MSINRALIIARQAGAAWEFAARKGGSSVSERTIRQKSGFKIPRMTLRKSDEPKVKKQPYKPGKSKLGLSAVSEAIKKDYGIISNRRNRKLIAKAVSKLTTLKRYYNGEGPVRVKHNIKPSKYLGVRKRAAR